MHKHLSSTSVGVQNTLGFVQGCPTEDDIDRVMTDINLTHKAFQSTDAAPYNSNSGVHSPFTCPNLISVQKFPTVHPMQWLLASSAHHKVIHTAALVLRAHGVSPISTRGRFGSV